MFQGAPSAAEIGPEIERQTRGLERQVSDLYNGPATKAQVLGVAPVEIGIDFGHHERTLAVADAILARQPDAMFEYRAADECLASHADELRKALRRAEPFRKFAKP